jgi:hypothetical protein
MPACLPLTTDFCPQKETWKKTFDCRSDYTLLLNEIREQYDYVKYVKDEGSNRISTEQVKRTNKRILMKFKNKYLNKKKVFTDLVGHRLAMGFQMVVPEKTFKFDADSPNTANNTSHFICDLSSSASVLLRSQAKSIKGYYKLSIGRIYHELFYIVDPSDKSECIKVVIYTPKKSFDSEPIHYNYRFQVPDSDEYETQYCEISRVEIEKISWNNLDSYICIQGNGTLSIDQLQKCWRMRIYVIPIFFEHDFTKNYVTQNKQNYFTKNNDNSVRFDFYQTKTKEELLFIRDYFFIRFIEGLNKLERADDRRMTSRATRAFLNTSSGASLTNTNMKAKSLSSEKLTNYDQNEVMLFNNNNQSVLTAISSIKQLNIVENKLVSPYLKLYPMIETYLELKSTETSQTKVDIENFKLQIQDYLNSNYKSQLLNKSTGVPLINNKADIPLNCFTSSEGVWWCIDNIDDIDNEENAILFMQTLLNFDIINHISNQQSTFFHGFYLYYIITDESRSHCLYTKDYCEVGYYYLEAELLEMMDFFKNLKNKFPLLSEYSRKDFMKISQKWVNVDVDTSNRSNRNEWASAVYYSHYHQSFPFELKIQWEMATGELLAELIGVYAKLANKFNFHIVPVPLDPFPEGKLSDPLRRPISIKIDFNSSFKAKEIIIFQNFINNFYKLNLQLNGDKNGDCSSCCCYQLNSNDKQILKMNSHFQQFLTNQQKNENQVNYFHDFIEEERIKRVEMFQEFILQRFDRF